MRILRLLDKWDMSAPMEGEWVPLSQEDPMQKGKVLKSISLQLSFSGAAGPSLNGLLLIEGSNDGISVCYRKQVHIDSPSNISDSLLLIFNHVFYAFRLRYLPNALTAGELNAVLLLK